MKYLCLVYGEESVVQGLSPQDSRALTHDSLEYNKKLERAGHLILAQALEPVKTAKTVRVRKKKVRLSDGPFAETKEQLLGFVYIEARDHEQALELAANIPLAELGSIEVRAIMDLNAD